MGDYFEELKSQLSNKIQVYIDVEKGDSKDFSSRLIIIASNGRL